MGHNHGVCDRLLLKINNFVDTCLKTRVYKSNSKVKIITEEETLDILKEIKKIGDEYERENRQYRS